jgi:hypothetical protein
MTKVKIKVDFEVGAGEDSAIKQGVNEKFSNKIIENETVPRIGECVDLLKISPVTVLAKKSYIGCLQESIDTL